MLILNNFFLTKLFLLIYFTFTKIQAESLDCYSTCLKCSAPGNLTNQNCTKCKNGYYFDELTSNCYDCYYSCETCNENGTKTNNNCLSCKTGYYTDELITSNCNACYHSCSTCIIGPNSTSHNCLECKSRYYFDSGQCFECMDSCQECSNSYSCDICYKGYFFLNGTQTCLLSKSYVNYYVNEDNYLTKCDEPCYQCKSSSLGEDEQNCFSCIWGYSYNETNNNCKLCKNNSVIIIQPNFTCDRVTADKCYNYKTSCIDINDFKTCPYEAPVYIKDNMTCSIGYCNNSEYNESNCVINNQVFNNQLINNFIQLSNSDSFYLVSIALNTKDLICITDLYGTNANQIIFMLNEKGRLFLYDDNSQKFVISKSIKTSKFYSIISESIVIKTQENDSFILTSYDYGVITLNMNGDFINFFNGNDIFPDFRSFCSEKITLLELKSSNKNEYYYLFGFIKSKLNVENGEYYYYLSLFKFKFISGDLSNTKNFQLINEFNNKELMIRRFSKTVTCYQTDNKIIHCLYTGTDTHYYVSIFDDELNYLGNFNIHDVEKSTAHYYYFTKCIHLKKEIGVYFYAETHLQIRMLKKYNNDYILINYIPLVCDTSITINHSYYYFQQNDLIKLSDTELGFISFANEIIYIIIFSLYNNDLYLNVRYYSIPTLIYNKIPILKIVAFNYQNFFGISYGYKERNYNSLNGDYDKFFSYAGLIIFSYCNSTDPDSISDFQTLKNVKMKLSDYIQINNNIFGHELYGIKIINVPDESSGIYLVSLNKKIKLLNGDILNKNDSVIFGYTLNKEIKGNYTIEFAGISTSVDYDIMKEYIIEEKYYGDEDFSSYYKTKKFIGKTAQFNINISEPQNVIDKSSFCESIILDDNSKCISCKNDNSFIIEDTNTCTDEINDDSYYFNDTRKMYMKCHSNCKSCISGPIYEENTYDVLVNTNCLECKNNFYMIGNTNNCSNENNINNFNLVENQKKYIQCPTNCKQCELLSNNKTIECKKCNDGYQYYEKENMCISCLGYIYFYAYNLSCIDVIEEGNFYTGQNLFYNRKIVDKCHDDCLTCSKYPDLDKNNMNCDSCDNGTNFYFIYGTKNCTNITPLYYYLDTKTEPYIIKKCPDNCLKCTNDQSDDEVKCDMCDYFNEYYLMYGTNNCATNITQHYYLDKKNKIYKPCYKLCLSCNNSENLLELNMNCESCDMDLDYYLIENTKNCTNNLPLHYYFDKISKIFRKCYYKCDNCEIGGNETNMNCISCKKFYKYNSTILRCTENCPYKYFYYDNNKNLVCLKLNELCPDYLPFENITTKECLADCNSWDFIIKNCKTNNPSQKTQEIIINNMIDSIQNRTIDSLLPNISGDSKDIIIQEDNNILQITTTSNQNNNNYTNVSTIYLGECENLLKNYYNISLNLSLLIFKIEAKIEGSLHPNVQYEVYHPLTKEKLDLTICNKSKIVIDYQVKINENELFKYDPNDDYYNDVCYVYSNEDGVDITLNDRKNEYVYNNMSLCENNCEFTSYNNITKKVNCECNVKIFISISDLFSSDYKTILDNFINPRNKMNLNLLKCAKVLFTKEGFLYNICNFIMLIIIIIDIILACMFYLKGFNYINSIIKDLLVKKSRKKINLNANSNNLLLIENENGNKSSSSTPIGNLNQASSPSPKRITNNLMKKNQTISINNNATNNFKKKKKKKKKKINIKNTSKEIIFKGKKITEIKPKKNKVKLISKVKNKFNDTELDGLEYIKAIKYDKRTYVQYYWSLLKKKHLLLFSFLPSNDYNLIIIKIDLFFFTIALNFTVNALFFNDATMHNIYENNGKLNFIYHIPQIIYSTLITVVMGIIIKSLCLTEKDILQLKKENDYMKAIEKSKEKIKNFKIKFFLFFALTFVLLPLFWYYLSCFCAVYKNTQEILVEDTMSSITLSFIYPFGLYLIPGVFRIPALNDKKKDKDCVFKLSKLLALI